MTDDDYWAFYTLERIYGCGCWNPEIAWLLVRDILRLMPLYEDGRSRECERLIGSPGAFMIVLDRMTDADLIDHGGGIGGSWLRPEGERMLRVLDPIADWDGMCEWSETVEMGGGYSEWLEAHDDTVRP